MKTPVCECGGEKHLYALRCHNCYNRRWTEEEDGLLRAMIEEGVPQKLIGDVIGRSLHGIRSRVRILGLKVSWEAHQRNRIVACRAFWADPDNRAAARAKWDERYGHLREAARERTREANLAGKMGVGGVGHSKATRRKMSAAQLARHDKRLGFAPRNHPLRKEYTRLVRRRGMAKAAVIVQEKLEARKLRAVMQADGGRAPTMMDDEAPASREAIWCDQCERRRQPNEIAACQSPFCAVKQAIAA